MATAFQSQDNSVQIRHHLSRSSTNYCQYKPGCILSHHCLRSLPRVIFHLDYPHQIIPFYPCVARPFFSFTSLPMCLVCYTKKKKVVFCVFFSTATIPCLWIAAHDTRSNLLVGIFTVSRQHCEPYNTFVNLTRTRKASRECREFACDRRATIFDPCRLFFFFFFQFVFVYVRIQEPASTLFLRPSFNLKDPTYSDQSITVNQTANGRKLTFGGDVIVYM